MAYDVFLSYSRKDAETADIIYQTLEAAGIRCFIDHDGISGGSDFPKVLSEAIMDAKIMLYVASKNAYQSDYTQKELTFAVTKKGSRFIFPLIIDGSTLPQHLEFLLSDINWRSLSSRYTIEKDLVEDVRQKLLDPNAGQTLKQRETNAAKVLFLAVIALLALSAGGFIWYQSWRQKQEIRAKEAERSTAHEAREECLGCLEEGRQALCKADTLCWSGRPLATFEEEVACLLSAGKALDRADSLLLLYNDNDTYARLFNGLSTAPLRARIEQKRDSMFTVWSGYALSNYREYEAYPADVYRDEASACAVRALALRPEDARMRDIQTKTNRQ